MVNYSGVMRWQFVALFALVFSLHGLSKDYYWVGDGGEWNDATHWATVSGGTGGAGIPGLNDDVFFDGNSFTVPGQVVTINDAAYCRDLNATQVGQSMTFMGRATHIKVGGSFEVTYDAHWDYYGDIIFTANDNDNVINGGDQQLKSNLIFDGKGEWTLTNNLGLRFDGELELLQGTLITNGWQLFMGTLRAPAGKKRGMELSNSIIYVNKELDLGNVSDLNIDAGTSLFKLANDIPEAKRRRGDVGDQHFEYRITCGNNITVNMTITSNYNGQDISCNGACDAEVTVEVCLPGNAACDDVTPCGWSVSFQGGPFTSQLVYPGECAGNVSATVLDSCQMIFPGIFEQCTENINITEPPIIFLNVLGIVDPSCPDSCDGQAFVAAGGGTGSLSINWNNGETGTNPQMLCVGQNYVTITDDNGCVEQDSVTILDPPPIIAGVDITDPSCFGFCDGVVFSSPSGGNGGPWTWTWDPALTVGGGPDTTINVCSGTYTLDIMDVDGCPYDTTFTVTDPPPLVITVDNVVNNVCATDCLGEITVSASAGTSPYTYEWFDCATGLPIGQTSPTATGLCNGDYYVEVTDAGGCILPIPCETISSPPLLTVTTTINNDASCFGICDGSITAFPAGGTGPGTYTYEWFDCATGLPQGGVAQTNSTLCGANSYYVVVTDGNGCTVQSSPCDSIIDPLPITVPTTVTQISCFGICDGEILAAPTGGTTPYVLEWQNCATGLPIGQTLNPATALCQGEYQLQVTDANGCMGLSACDTIIEPPQITFSPVVTDVVCNGDCNGTITANPTGGTLPYASLNWLDCATGLSLVPPQGADPATGLCPGDYQLEVTDANGCVVSSSCETVTEPPPLTASVSSTPISCGGACDGTATATPAGGVTPYTYQWLDCATGLPIGQTTQTATNLCPGDYQAEVTDANGCVDITSCITLSPVPVLDITAVSTDETCAGTCDGTATGTATGGTTPYTYEWIDCATGLPVVPAQTTPNATNLCPGD